MTVSFNTSPNTQFRVGSILYNAGSIMEIKASRLVHRTSGVILGLFLLAHMAYIAAAMAGMQGHRLLLDALRSVYRFPPAEALLLACVLVLVTTGLRMVWRGWIKGQEQARRVQYMSGAYLAFFLLLHVGAVLVARGMLSIDTDIGFATAGLYRLPDALFFAPYYLLVVSIGVHLACIKR